MFQYAYYKELSFLYPNNVYADISYYKSKSHGRKFELADVFDLELNYARNIDVCRLTNKVPGLSNLESVRRAIENRIIRLFGLNFQSLHPHYLKLMEEGRKEFSKKSDYYLEGFWTNEDAFIDVKNEVISDFRRKLDNPKKSEINPNVYLNEWEEYDTVGVHIRRTDYLLEDTYVKLTQKYYREAINIIRKRIKHPLFVFFSDDIDYVEEKYKWLHDKVIIKGNNGDKSYKDLLLMCLCKHNIIANSTFSFWGAYLNNNPNKIVIAPDRYLRNANRALAVSGWKLIHV